MKKDLDNFNPRRDGHRIGSADPTLHRSSLWEPLDIKDHDLHERDLLLVEILEDSPDWARHIFLEQRGSPRRREIWTVTLISRDGCLVLGKGKSHISTRALDWISPSEAFISPGIFYGGITLKFYRLKTVKGGRNASHSSGCRQAPGGAGKPELPDAEKQHEGTAQDGQM